MQAQPVKSASAAINPDFLGPERYGAAHAIRLTAQRVRLMRGAEWYVGTLLAESRLRCQAAHEAQGSLSNLRERLMR